MSRTVRDSIVDKTKSLPRWSLLSSGGDRWLANKYSCCGEKQFHVRREGLSIYTRVVRGRASRRWPLSRWDLKEVRERAIQFCEERLSQAERNSKCKDPEAGMSWHVWRTVGNSPCGWRGVRKGRLWRWEILGEKAPDPIGCSKPLEGLGFFSEWERATTGVFSGGVTYFDTYFIRVALGAVWKQTFGGNDRRESCKETYKNLCLNDCGLDLGASSWDGEECLDSGHILRVEPTEFATGGNVEGVRVRGIRDDS